MTESLIVVGSLVVHLFLIGICLGLPKRTGWRHSWYDNVPRAWALGSFLIPEILLAISLGVILSQWERKTVVRFPRGTATVTIETERE